MELNLVMTIVARSRQQAMEDIVHNLKLPFALSLLAKGTATDKHLSLHGLLPTEYALILTVADGESTRKFMRSARLRMFIDIPGNGIMMSVPLKSVGGGKTMAYLTDNKTVAVDSTFERKTEECTVINILAAGTCFRGAQ